MKNRNTKSLVALARARARSNSIKNRKGITLIALIITIIVMLILVAVTIQVVIKSGLLSSASEAGEKYKGAAENEANLEKVTINGKEYNSIDEYIKDKNELGPVITDVIVTNKTTNKIEIEVETVKAEGATFTYTYRIKGEEEWQSPEETEVNGNTCKFINLADQTVYEIRVEVTTKNGTAEKIIEEPTGELETGTITFSDQIWTNGTAKVTATNTATKYQMQYQVNGITEGLWTNIENVAEIGGLKSGDTVYARIWDGTNGGEHASVTIDNAPPVITEQATYKEKTTDSITVTATATDENGDNLTYTLYISTSETGEFTANGTSENNTSGTQATITATGLNQYTDYYYYVTVSDEKVTETGTTSPATKTYCPGTGLECTTLSCDGTQMDTCTTCEGNKIVTLTCSLGSIDPCSACSGTGSGTCGGTWYATESGVNRCWRCGSDDSAYYTIYKCSACGASAGFTHCSCGMREDSRAPHTGVCSKCDGLGKITTICPHKLTETHDYEDQCPTCLGTGEIAVTPCVHGADIEHRFCSHYTNTTVTSHQYCSHDKTEKHDD